MPPRCACCWICLTTEHGGGRSTERWRDQRSLLDYSHAGAHVQKVLIDRHAIASRVAQVAQKIAVDLGREGNGQGPPEITLVPILTGSIIFVSDLVRHLPLRMKIRLVSVSSYAGPVTTSQGARLEQQLTNLPVDLAGAHVLVIDDILDSGHTMALVLDLLRQRRPASLRTCVLLRKQRPRNPDVAGR